MTLKWSSTYEDAPATYIAAVEAADGQALEEEVKTAYTEFILGCMSDGIWDAIKSSCILAGARTLSGALVPLVGTAPTNNNFVSGDYNRNTGLVGDGTTKYLDSNRANNADPTINKHLSVYVSTHHTRNVTRADIGNGGSSAGASSLLTAGSNRYFRINWTDPGLALISDATTSSGLWAASRSNADSVTGRYANQNYTLTAPIFSTTSAGTTKVFSRDGNLSDARLSFYSIGEALDLALLDNRVSALMTTLGGLSL